MTYHEEETPNGTTIRAFENPVDEDNLKLELKAGSLTIRADLDHDTAHRLADALQRWYTPTTVVTHYGAGPLPVDEMGDWLNPTTPLPGRVATDHDVAVDLASGLTPAELYGVTETVTHHDFYDTIREYRSGRDNVTYTIPGGGL